MVFNVAYVLNTDKLQMVEDVTVLNNCKIGSDHRMVRSKIRIDLGKERYKLIRKTTKQMWTGPTDTQGFETHITNTLQNNVLHDTNINSLNREITEALKQGQDSFCPKSKKEEKISQITKNLILERNQMKTFKHITSTEMREKNKEISKAIRRDIRNYHGRKT